METQDALEDADLTSFLDEEDEDLNETQALYRERASYLIPEDLTVEVVPMRVGEVTCPTCYLVVPAGSLNGARCRECD